MKKIDPSRRTFIQIFHNHPIILCTLLCLIYTGGAPLTSHAQNIFYPEKITGKIGFNQITEVPDNIFYMETGNECNKSDEKEEIDKLPISVARNSTFTVEIEMDRCPDGLELNFLEGMHVEWSYTGQGTALAGLRRVERVFGNTASLWRVTLPTPEKVGVYTIDLRFIMVCCRNAPDFELSRKVFVTNNLNEQTVQDIGIPNINAYDKAATWAAGTTDENVSLEKLLGGIYDYGRNNWLYDGAQQCRSANGSLNASKRVKWEFLIDDDDSCKNGNCYNFRDVLGALARVLGISGAELTETRGKGGILGQQNGKVFYYPFVTKTGLASVDPNFRGNTRLKNSGTDYDRYTFFYHARVKRNNKYYDPTFNTINSDEHEFIEFNTNAKSISPNTNLTVYETLESARLFLINDPSIPFVYRGWRAHELELPAPNAIAKNGVGKRESIAQTPPIISNVSFSQSGDGSIADTLLVTIQADLPDTASYFLYATLDGADELIAATSSYNSNLPTGISLEGGIGVQEFELAFSGEVIYQSGTDGPYTLELWSDTSRYTFDSPAYLHSEFGELSVRIDSSYSAPVDSDGNGLFDALQVTTDVTVRQDAQFDLEVAVLKGDESITSAFQSFDLIAGSHTVELMVPGEPFGDQSGNYTYNLISSVTGLNEPTQNSYVDSTAILNSADFESFLLITSDVMDTGNDQNGDTLFEELRISFDAEVDSTGFYEFSSVLNDPDGVAFAFATESVYMTAGQSEPIELGFSYLRINAHEKNGAYSIADVFIQGDDGQVLDQAALDHTTGSYDYQEFNPAFTLTFEDQIDEELVDSDSNGLTDTLIVMLDVTSTRDGVLEATGYLYDENGKELALGRGSVQVTAGTQAELPLTFDGRYLYGSLQNDAFSLQEVNVYPTGYFDQNHLVEHELYTSPFDYQSFEPAAVVVGAVQDPVNVGSFATGAFVFGSGASDTVGDDGLYRLVFLDGGSKSVQVSYSGAGGNSWQVYVDDSYVGDQSLVFVDGVLGEVRRVDFRSWDLLPVELTQLNALVDGSQVTLTWETASEENNAGFEVQYQLIDGGIGNGKGWTIETFIPGSGTTSERQSYSYTIQNLQTGEYQLRLKQVDFDGTVSYSDPVTAHIELLQSHLVSAAYPNPFNPSTLFTVEVQRSQLVSVRAYDILGREVAKIFEGPIPQNSKQQFQFDASGMASGVYLIWIEGEFFVSQLSVTLLE